MSPSKNSMDTGGDTDKYNLIVVVIGFKYRQNASLAGLMSGVNDCAKRNQVAV